MQGRGGCVGPRGAVQARVLSLQRQMSARHSPAEMEAPAGTSQGPLSASAPQASPESTVRQVGAVLAVPCRPGAHTHTVTPQTPQANPFSTSSDPGCRGGWWQDSPQGPA